MLLIHRRMLLPKQTSKLQRKHAKKRNVSCGTLEIRERKSINLSATTHEAARMRGRTWLWLKLLGVALEFVVQRFEFPDNLALVRVLAKKALFHQTVISRNGRGSVNVGGSCKVFVSA